ncbi:MAG: DUF2795 domain-containing protein [Actinobacteria bacterium]|nr:DUF2795 domain-containing protein [Actinomycetota bacterium]
MTSREAILDAVADTFTGDVVTKATIIDSAERSLAPSPVMQALHLLPDINFRSPRDLWQHMPTITKGDRS